MTLLSDRPTREEWIKTSDAASTQCQYRNVLYSFDEWLKSQNATEDEFFQAMRDADMNTRARTVKAIQEYWLTVPREGYTLKGARTTAQYRTVLLLWFEENDIIISASKLKRLAKLPKIPNEMRYTPDSSVVLQIVMQQTTIDKKAFFILLATTAMRHGELRTTRLKDMDISERMIRIPAERTKTNTERLTFFTPEARHYLKRHLKENNITDPDELIFPRDQVTYHFAMVQAMKKLDLTEKFKNGRNKMSMHRLRAHASQCISDAVSDRFADVIKGHIGGLRTYDVGNIRKMKKDYDKAIPALTLDKSQQYEDLKDNLDAKGRTDSVIMREIDHLKEELQRLKNSETL